MKTALLISQIIFGLILVILILVQSKGTGFGRAWGGSTSFTRRGLEKVVFRLSFIIASAFIIVSILQVAL
jgi:protein translocase SecG subunit